MEITDALDQLLKNNDNISFEKITDYWKDTGTPEDIIHANGEIITNMLINSKKEKVDHIIGQDSVIESDVKITGPDIIGKNCRILSNTSIGPNVSVGDNTIISASSIRDSIIMKNCVIKSSTEIKDSIIANNSEIEDGQGGKKIFLLGEGSKIKL